VNPHVALRTGSASGVARLVLVAAALVGFLAMHGFDMTDGAGSHHAVTVEAVLHAPVEDPHAMAVGPASDDAPPLHQVVMSGCLFILLAAGGAFVLFAPTRTTGPYGSASRPARAPPRPLFLSLCVFRL
jgi:hypothetical protein